MGPFKEIKFIQQTDLSIFLKRKLKYVIYLTKTFKKNKSCVVVFDISINW